MDQNVSTPSSNLRLAADEAETAVSSPRPAPERRQLRYPVVAQADYCPIAKDRLAFGWYGTYLEIGIYRKDKIQASVAIHRDVASLADFEAAIDSFLRKTSYKGKRAAGIIDGGILNSSVETLPPSPKRAQMQYVREKSKRLIAEDGPVVWDLQAIAPSKNSDRGILYCIRRSDLDRIVETLRKREILLTTLVPAISIAPQACAKHLSKEIRSTLVVVPIGDSLRVIALNRSGELELARALTGAAASDGARAAVEVNRCSLFARQQFGQSIEHVAILSGKDHPLEKALREGIGSEVGIGSQAVGQDLWLAQAFGKNGVNLAREGIEQDRRKHLHQVIALFGYAAAMAIGFGFYAIAERDGKDAQRRVLHLLKERDGMQLVVNTIAAREERAEKLQDLAFSVEQINRPPVERALLALLTNGLPSDLQLQKLAVSWQEDTASWNVKLILASDEDPKTVAQQGEDLQRLLAESPLGFHVQHSTIDSLSRIIVRGQDSAAQTIVIEGEIRFERATKA